VTPVTAIAALIAVVALATASAALAQDSAPPFSITPVMSRGPATAPVTIVEFSDYQ
jgi:protein-disulfide isomerase